MNLPLILRDEAEHDAEDTRNYYDRQQAGLGGRFLVRLNEALARIQAMPKAYGIIGKNVRIKKLSKFPYVVYYRLHSDRIEVLAILHGSRDSSIWRDRA